MHGGTNAVILSLEPYVIKGGGMNTDERQEYVRPELRSYGAITRLVQSGSGIDFEGSSGMIGMM